MAIRTLLIDDEHLAIAELTHMLAAYADIEIVGKAQEAGTAIQLIRHEKPDLIFLDINMPEKNGFDMLSELDEAPQVIFVTAYDQYAIKAFEVNALDYLLKPVNKTRLEEAVSKVKRQMQKEASAPETLPIHKRIFIKDGEQCFFAPLSDICIFESAGNYVKVFFDHKKPLLHRSLNYMEERLPGSHFFRASRQHIINIEFIKKIVPFHNNTLRVTMENGMEVDISQRQSVRFKELMGV
jgi:two-component system, LytTR family, response regulator